VGKDLAAQTAGSTHCPWRISRSPALTLAMPNAYFASLGLPSLAPARQINQPNRRVRTRTHGGVTGTAREGLPLSMIDHVPQNGFEKRIFTSASGIEEPLGA